jgi:hypothetical protein
VCFSNNIYEELHITSIRKEYIKTRHEKEIYDEALKTGKVEDSPAVQHLMKRLDENLEIMKELCYKWAAEARIQNPSDDPVEAFD